MPYDRKQLTQEIKHTLEDSLLDMPSTAVILLTPSIPTLQSLLEFVESRTSHCERDVFRRDASIGKALFAGCLEDELETISQGHLSACLKTSVEQFVVKDSTVAVVTSHLLNNACSSAPPMTLEPRRVVSLCFYFMCNKIVLEQGCKKGRDLIQKQLIHPIILKAAHHILEQVPPSRAPFTDWIDLIRIMKKHPRSPCVSELVDIWPYVYGTLEARFIVENATTEVQKLRNRNEAFDSDGLRSLKRVLDITDEMSPSSKKFKV